MRSASVKKRFFYSRFCRSVIFTLEIINGNFNRPLILNTIHAFCWLKKRNQYGYDYMHNPGDNHISTVTLKT